MLVVVLGGCEWVMGGIPSEPDASQADGGDFASGADGGSRGDRADGDGDADEGVPGAGDGGAGDPSATGPGGASLGGNASGAHGGGGSPAGSAGGSPAGSGAGSTGAGAGGVAGSTDGGSAARDSGTVAPPASDAGSVRSDAATLDAAASCAQPTWWYQDDDEDGYGRASAKVSACAPPGKAWAERAGDCNDDAAQVHPAQTDFFDKAYQAADGSMSFDYDCSGHEEGNGQQQAAPEDCGILALLNCTGSGYAVSARADADNPQCGSRTKTFCQGALLGAVGCVSSPQDVAEPYWCH